MQKMRLFRKKSQQKSNKKAKKKKKIKTRGFGDCLSPHTEPH